MPTDREKYGEHSKSFIDGKWVKGRKLPYDNEGNLKVGVTTYMVKDYIWNKAQGSTSKEGMDTILELEQKLGRKLTLRDFTDAPVNWSEKYLEAMKSRHPEDYEVLMDRIGGDNGRKELAKEYLKREKWFPEKGSKTAFHVKEVEELLR